MGLYFHVMRAKVKFAFQYVKERNTILGVTDKNKTFINLNDNLKRIVN